MCQRWDSSREGAPARRTRSFFLLAVFALDATRNGNTKLATGGLRDGKPPAAVGQECRRGPVVTARTSAGRPRLRATKSKLSLRDSLCRSRRPRTRTRERDRARGVLRAPSGDWRQGRSSGSFAENVACFLTCGAWAAKTRASRRCLDFLACSLTSSPVYWPGQRPPRPVLECRVAQRWRGHVRRQRDHVAEVRLHAWDGCSAREGE
jgi:hypothetical protein